MLVYSTFLIMSKYFLFECVYIFYIRAIMYFFFVAAISLSHSIAITSHSICHKIKQETKMNCEIIFRTAIESERDKVLQFLRDYFFTEEPINRAYPIRDDSMEEEFLLSLLPSGNIILAIDATTNNETIAGLACIGEITKNYSKESWDESETTENLKWRDILKFMSHIEAKSNVCERFNVTKAVHLHGVTVNKNYRGKSLGKKLFQECFKIAKMRNYKFVSADCTSIYSIHIAESVGMEFVSMVTYDEYHEKIGQKIFNPIHPHTEIKTFVKRI